MCRVNFHQMRWNLRWNLWGLPSYNSQVKHLQKEKVKPSIWKEKKLTEFAPNTCSAIQGSRPHQNTTSLLPCVASTSIRCVGTCVGTCGVYHLAIPKWNICKKKRLSLPWEKKRSWQNLHRTDALQFKALGLIRILPACCHVSRQLPSDTLELVGSAGWIFMVLPFLESNTDHLIQFILLNPLGIVKDSSVGLHQIYEAVWCSLHFGAEALHAM